MNNPIKDLEDWYHAQCDGEWEHGCGIEIGTLDNPGWHLEINLKDTSLETLPFQEMKVNYEDELDWMICKKQGDQFDAAGGPHRLSDMITVFLEWAKSAKKK